MAFIQVRLEALKDCFLYTLRLLESMFSHLAIGHFFSRIAEFHAEGREHRCRPQFEFERAISLCGQVEKLDYVVGFWKRDLMPDQKGFEKFFSSLLDRDSSPSRG